MLDRRLFTAMAYPADYGYVEGTLARGRRPARRARARLRPDLPRLPDPRAHDRRLPHGGREGPRREAACASRSATRRSSAIADIHDVAARAARRDRALLPALQGSRAVEADRDARLGQPERGGEDPHRGARAQGRLSVAAPEPIDLLHLGRERVIASYLLDTDRRAGALRLRADDDVDALKAGLAARGLALTDVRHLLLSHIHLDHAGAAGVLVREHPALQVHVSAIGAPHLVDPSGWRRARAGSTATRSTRSGASSRRCRRRTSTPSTARVLGLDSFPTPGHASHHVCYLDPDGTLYAGDACGVRVLPGPLRHAADAAARRRRRGVGGHARRDRAPRSRAARAHPLRRRRGRRAPPRPSCGSTCSTGPSRSRAARRRRSSSSTRSPSSPTRGEDAPTYDSAMPLWQSYRGLARWAEKRAAT